MSSDSQNFEQLRKLLALKRHEQPPPGYFNNFSDEVISRIRADREGAKDLSEILKPAPWLLRLFGLMETKPIFAGAFGVAVCAMLIAGIVYSEQMKFTPVATIAVPVINDASLVSANSTTTDPLVGRMQMTATTNAAALEAQTLFEQVQVKAKPVGFSSPGGF